MRQLLGFQIAAFGDVDLKRTATFFDHCKGSGEGRRVMWAPVSEESDNAKDGIDF